MEVKADWSWEINLKMVYIFYFQVPLCIQSVNKQQKIKRKSSSLGRQLFMILALCFQNEVNVQTSPAAVGEFVHLGQVRSHLQKIPHSSRLPLLKLQERLLLFKPSLSMSDKVSQALLTILCIRRAGKACSEEGVRVTEPLSNTGLGVQVS